MRIHSVVNALRHARRARGWTRSQLAEQAGVHRRTIDGWEPQAGWVEWVRDEVVLGYVKAGALRVVTL